MRNICIFRKKGKYIWMFVGKRLIEKQELTNTFCIFENIIIEKWNIEFT